MPVKPSTSPGNAPGITSAALGTPSGTDAPANTKTAPASNPTTLDATALATTSTTPSPVTSPSTTESSTAPRTRVVTRWTTTAEGVTASCAANRSRGAWVNATGTSQRIVIVWGDGRSSIGTAAIPGCGFRSRSVTGWPSGSATVTRSVSVWPARSSRGSAGAGLTIVTTGGRFVPEPPPPHPATRKRSPETTTRPRTEREDDISHAPASRPTKHGTARGPRNPV